MKKLILLGLCILFVGLVSAATYEQSKELDLKVPCINNNTFCSGSATCNLTILNPNSSNLIYGEGMTNSATYFNYSLTPSQTLIIGEYTVTAVCADGSENGYTIYTYDINPSGRVISEGGGSSIIAIIIFVMGLSFLFIYLATNLQQEHSLLSILFFLSSILILVIGAAIVNNITGTLVSEELGSRADYLYWFIVTIFVLVMLYTIIYFIFYYVLWKKEMGAEL